MLLFHLFFALLHPGDSVQACKVLAQAEKTIRATRTLSYHSEFRQVYSAMDDSLTVVAGTIWLERIPGDTIFGYRFHEKGDGDEFDYYYNGKLSREFRHKDREISEFYPYKGHSAFIAAKARVALLPVVPLETDTALLANMLDHCAALALIDSGYAWVVTKTFQASGPGSSSTQSVWIDKNTNRIIRSETFSLYNGTRSHKTLTVSAIVADTDISDSLVEPAGLAYKTTRWVKPAPPKRSPLEGRHAKDFTYPAFDGQSITLSGLRGQYVLLDFWESWCGWCIEAFPHLAALDSAYRGRNFRLLAIVSENQDKVQAILDANRLPYSTLKADEKIIRDYQVSGRPTYVLIDPAGKIIAYGPGDLDRMKALLEEKLCPPAKPHLVP